MRRSARLKSKLIPDTDESDIKDEDQTGDMDTHGVDEKKECSSSNMEKTKKLNKSLRKRVSIKNVVHESPKAVLASEDSGRLSNSEENFIALDENNLLDLPSAIGKSSKRDEDQMGELYTQVGKKKESRSSKIEKTRKSIKSSRKKVLKEDVAHKSHKAVITSDVSEENFIALDANDLQESPFEKLHSPTGEEPIDQDEHFSYDTGKPTESNSSAAVTSSNIKTDVVSEQSATESPKKFRFDLSGYAFNDTYENSSPLLRTISALKKHFPFKEHIRSCLASDVSKPEQLDQVIMTKAVPKSDAALNSEIDSSNLGFDTTAAGVKRTIAKNKEIENLMKKSVLPDDLEKMDKTPKLFESEFKKRLARKTQREETAGKGWYNLPKTEVTEEVKRDLQIIKMRNVLDSKHHYKRNDSNKLPKYFQIGTIVDGAHEFYSGRVPKKQRKRTIVQELLDDAELRRRNKKKLVEIKKRQMGKGKDYYKKVKNKKKSKWERT